MKKSLQDQINDINSKVQWIIDNYCRRDDAPKQPKSVTTTTY